MSLLASIDYYCERISADIFAEPLNAISNLSFIIAAALLYRFYKKHKVNDKYILFLISLVFKVGVGSLLFHTFANNLSLFADIIPIVFFVLSYLFYVLRYLLGYSKQKSVMGLGILLLAIAAVGYLPPELHFNGSVSYFPILIALGFIAFKSRKAMLYVASFIFAASLMFRSVDQIVCSDLAIGTHFIWHILNGALLYLLVKVLINDCAENRRV